MSVQIRATQVSSMLKDEMFDVLPRRSIGIAQHPCEKCQLGMTVLSAVLAHEHIPVVDAGVEMKCFVDNIQRRCANRTTD